MEKIIEIPEGYEARIEGDKVVLEPKESEDERIRSFLYEFIKVCGWSEKQYPPREKCLAYLERQKGQKPLSPEDKVKHPLYVEGFEAGKEVGRQFENVFGKQEPVINIEHLKSYLLQYLQDASNREDDSEIEADTDKWARMIIKVFGGVEQKPAEWSEEDEKMMNRVFDAYDALRSYIEDNEISSEKDKNYQIKMLEGEVYWLKNRLKSLRPQPKQESEPIEIKFAGKIYKVYGTKELPGGVVGYIIEDEPGHYDCIIHPDEVLGGGYGIKSNGSPYPTKEANFGQPHWKPSEEQMEWLEQAVRLSADKSTIHRIVLSLYDALRQL